jgi:hypothetical protein
MAASGETFLETKRAKFAKGGSLRSDLPLRPFRPARKTPQAGDESSSPRVRPPDRGIECRNLRTRGFADSSAAWESLQTENFPPALLTSPRFPIKSTLHQRSAADAARREVQEKTCLRYSSPSLQLTTDCGGFRARFSRSFLTKTPDAPSIRPLEQRTVACDRPGVSSSRLRGGNSGEVGISSDDGDSVSIAE